MYSASTGILLGIIVSFLLRPLFKKMSRNELMKIGYKPLKLKWYEWFL